MGKKHLPSSDESIKRDVLPLRITQWYAKATGTGFRELIVAFSGNS